LTGFSRRARGERGFALVAALLIALLFLGLIELTLRDTSEGVRGAHRQRARLASEILADNAVELAAAGMLFAASKDEERTAEAGSMRGSYRRLPGDRFELTGEGVSGGVDSVTTHVVLSGRIAAEGVVIEASGTW
jgi:hypothetical protein